MASTDIAKLCPRLVDDKVKFLWVGENLKSLWNHSFLCLSDQVLFWFISCSWKGAISNFGVDISLALFLYPYLFFCTISGQEFWVMASQGLPLPSLTVKVIDINEKELTFLFFSLILSYKIADRPLLFI